MGYGYNLELDVLLKYRAPDANSYTNPIVRIMKKITKIQKP